LEGALTTILHKQILLPFLNIMASKKAVCFGYLAHFLSLTFTFFLIIIRNVFIPWNRHFEGLK